jgi:L,D-peptidoglycan transpeptidase YkuD (ErfK/YbiS/YcfS/YnhG family)
MTEAIVTGDGWLTLGATRYRCAIGRAGLRQHKMEGDEATPIGTLPLRRILFRADRIRPFPCAVPREPLAPQDGWCDDPQDKAYNTLIRLPHDAPHERRWRDPGGNGHRSWQTVFPDRLVDQRDDRRL